MSFLSPSIGVAPTRAYSVTRSSGQYVSGVWAADAPAAFSVTGHHQPLGIKEAEALKPLPEGTHVEDLRRLYTEGELQPKDVVTIDGDEFEVWRVGRWPHPGGGAHYEAVCSRRVRQ